MMKGKFRTFSIALGFSLILALMIAGVALAAVVIIDTFNAAPQSLVADAAQDPVFGVGSDSSILGNERDVLVDYFAGPGALSVKIDEGSGSGSNRLAFSQDESTSGRATVTWDGVDGSQNVNPTGLCSPGCVDLTDGGANQGLKIIVFFDDLPLPVKFRIYNGSTANYKEYTVNLPGGIPSNSSVAFFIPFSGFTNVGPGPNYPNFNSVGAIQLIIDGQNSAGADMSLTLFQADNQKDYGDAPVSYGESGHTPNGSRFGTNIDSEASQLYSPGALGDDNDQVPDDEDGVARTPGKNWTRGTAPTQGGSVDITMNGCPATPCYLNAWIDWNQDGVFGPGEQIFSDQPIPFNGITLSYAFNIPTDAPIAQGTNSSFFARFRLYSSSTGGTASPTGDVTGGEDEDYFWGFGPTAITLSSLVAHSNPSGVTSLFLLTGGLLVAGGWLIVALTRRRRA